MSAMEATTQTTPYTLRVSVQAQLGAVARVLDALTHRGILPQRFEATLTPDEQTQTIVATFSHTDPHAMTKLTQFLEKQVQVATVSLQATP
jgi:acetolactate synthase regulatory subunit